MAQASQQDDESGELRLEDALLYLFGRESKNREGAELIVPLSSVHRIVKEIEPELRDMGVRLKFHEGSEIVHSKQVDEAINNLIPYLIPVRNPSFSLDVYEEVGQNALRESKNELSEYQIEKLEDIFDSDRFREAVREHTQGKDKG